MKKRLAVIFSCLLFLCSSIPVSAEEEIIRSNVDYEVTLRDAALIFIGNNKEVDWKVGDKYFLTYTVENVMKDENFQSGMIATADRTLSYPYLDGSMQYSQDPLLSEEGYTYFFRFEVTETGWKYVAAKAKGEKSEYLTFPHTEGEVDKKTPYFGVWLGEGEGLTVDLTHVRCYDAKGNDLGIYAPLASSISISEMRPMEDVNHTYNFSLEDASCIAFGSAKKTTSDAMFLEYTIQNVKAEGVNQNGAIMTNAPTDVYPFAGQNGYLSYSPHDAENPPKLISEGARYLVRMERGEDKFDVLVKRTMPNGEEEYFSFLYNAGEYKKELKYVAMWIGATCSLTADFVDVKCYDDEGNNLGIQTNQDVPIQHFGENEDYSRCEAVYYCRENNTFISLDDEKNASKRVDGDEIAVQGTYLIEQSIMKLTIGEEQENFDYYYDSFVDEDGNRYHRLSESKVTFYSKLVGGQALETVTVTAADGYKLEKPSNPEQEGKTFLNWIDGKEKEYDFDQVVMGSMDLYAAWDGEGLWELTSVLGTGSNVASALIVSAISVALIGGTISGVYFVNRRRSNGSEKKESK